MWTIPANEGEDPIKRLSETRSAHAQIHANGTISPDRIFAYAMTRFPSTTFGSPYGEPTTTGDNRPASGGRSYTRTTTGSDNQRGAR